MKKSQLTEALGVTYAAVGQEVSDAALEIIAGDLSGFDDSGVLESLSRCRRELRRISLADILDRIPNGHPGPEEAWSMISGYIGDEDATVVLTSAMRAAFFAADALSDDLIAARMAFKEVYIRDLALCRNEKPEWTVILGHDQTRRDDALRLAHKTGRLTNISALLSHKTDQTNEIVARLAEKYGEIAL